jgi:hypothetical protein
MRDVFEDGYYTYKKVICIVARLGAGLNIVGAKFKFKFSLHNYLIQGNLWDFIGNNFLIIS